MKFKNARRARLLKERGYLHAGAMRDLKTLPKTAHKPMQITELEIPKP